MPLTVELELLLAMQAMSIRAVLRTEHGIDVPAEPICSHEFVSLPAIPTALEPAFPAMGLETSQSDYTGGYGPTGQVDTKRVSASSNLLPSKFRWSGPQGETAQIPQLGVVGDTHVGHVQWDPGGLELHEDAFAFLARAQDQEHLTGLGAVQRGGLQSELQL